MAALGRLALGCRVVAWSAPQAIAGVLAIQCFHLELAGHPTQTIAGLGVDCWQLWYCQKGHLHYRPSSAVAEHALAEAPLAAAVASPAVDVAVVVVVAVVVLKSYLCVRLR